MSEEQKFTADGSQEEVSIDEAAPEDVVVETQRTTFLGNFAVSTRISALMLLGIIALGVICTIYFVGDVLLANSRDHLAENQANLVQNQVLLAEDQAKLEKSQHIQKLVNEIEVSINRVALSEKDFLLKSDLKFEDKVNLSGIHSPKLAS